MNNEDKRKDDIPDPVESEESEKRLKALFDRWAYEPGSFVSWSDDSEEEDDFDEEDDSGGQDESDAEDQADKT